MRLPFAVYPIQLALLLLASRGFSQAAGARPVEIPDAFDIVSIHPTNPSVTTEDLNYGDSQITAKGATIKFLIESAYQIRDFQIADLPKSVGDAKYDIVAKMDYTSPHNAGVGAGPDQEEVRVALIRKRLQNLLADRFRLRFHVVNKQAPILVLLKQPRSPQLRKASESEGYLRTHHLETGEQIEAKAVSLSELADRLSYVLGRQVVDRTGLSGEYDFVLNWAGDESQATNSRWPSLVTAIREQLGLRLVSRSGPTAIYVVDHLEAPTPN